MNHVTREQRREDAKARQAARAERSPAEQIRLLASRPGQSLKETARLNRSMVGRSKKGKRS